LGEVPKEVPRGVAVLDEEHEKFVREVFEQFQPGCYLIQGSYGEKRTSYFKMDKAVWLSLFAHDYAIASFRGDAEASEELRRVYDELAKALDWPEREPWSKWDLVELGWQAAEALFSFYREKLRVDGWRGKPDEAVWEAEERLLYAFGSIGDGFRRELGRWYALKRILDSFEAEVRPKDRVALFMAMELNCLVRRYINRVSWRHIYVNYVLGSLVSGSALERWVDEALWCAYKAVRRFEDLSLNPYVKFLDAECLNWMVMAAMAANEVDPYSGDPQAYLAELAGRLGRRDLISLYNLAVSGSEDGVPSDAFLSGVLEHPSGLSEEERRALKKMFEAGRKFLGEMAAIVDGEIERRHGYKVEAGSFEVERLKPTRPS